MQRWVTLVILCHVLSAACTGCESRELKEKKQQDEIALAKQQVHSDQMRRQGFLVYHQGWLLESVAKDKSNPASDPREPRTTILFKNDGTFQKTYAVFRKGDGAISEVASGKWSAKNVWTDGHAVGFDMTVTEVKSPFEIPQHKPGDKARVVSVNELEIKIQPVNAEGAAAGGQLTFKRIYP